MAITYVGGQSGKRAGSTSATDINFSLSGGIDTLPREGDLVVIGVSVGAADTNNPSCSISGYTALTQLLSTDQIFVSYQHSTSLNVSYKFMGSTPDTLFSLPSSGSANNGQTYTIQVFRGVNSSTPLDVTPTSALGENTTRCNPASITPTTIGAWILICGGGAALTISAAYTAPANYTVFLTQAQADTTDSVIGSGYRDTAWSSGAEDPAGYTGGSTSADSSWACYTIALRPAISGPANLKTYNTNLKANIKSINTNLIANIKSLNTNI